MSGDVQATDVASDPWGDLDRILVFLWSATGRPGSSNRQSQIDYGKHQARAAVERIVAERLYVELRRAADYIAERSHDIHPLSQAKGGRDTHLIGWREGRVWSHNHLRDRADAVLGDYELPSYSPGKPATTEADA